MAKYTKKQQEANRKLWVRALRSGDYDQAQGYLRKPNNEFCCLGVACDLYAKEEKGEWQHEGGNGHDVYTFRLKGSRQSETSLRPSGRFTTSLPKVVAEWLGLRHSDGAYGGNGSSLAGDNDEGQSFETIADTIEFPPDGLFGPYEN